MQGPVWVVYMPCTNEYGKDQFLVAFDAEDIAKSVAANQGGLRVEKVSVICCDGLVTIRNLNTQ